MQGVTGSIPVPPTKEKNKKALSKIRQEPAKPLNTQAAPFQAQRITKKSNNIKSEDAK